MRRTISTKEALIAEMEQGFQPEYVFFWQVDADSEERREYLSQWYPAEFVVDDITYLTAEHYMMAEKARVFGDDGIRTAILRTFSPETVKKLGRMVRGFDSVVWEKHRLEVVLRGNEAKFGQNEALRNYLLSTGDKILVEASPFDEIWGVGLAEDDPRITDPRQWNGLNLLGFALMTVRTSLMDD